MLNTDGDIGRHITIGSYILEHWKIPTHDLFSHTMQGQFLVPHEWLAQVAFAAVYKIANLGGVVFLVSLVIALTFTLVFRRTVSGGVFRLTAFFTTILAAFASNLHWLTRPHIFTFLFVAIWIYLFESKLTRWWYFPLLMLLWVNTHGAFIAGFAIWFAFFAGWFWDFLNRKETKSEGIRHLSIGLSSLLVTLINPVGWRLWNTSVGYFGNRFLIDKTIEYQSPNFHNSNTWPFLIMLVLFFMALGLKGKLQSHEMFLLIGWGTLSLYNARNIPIFAIVMAPSLGKIFQENIQNIPLLSRIENNFAVIEKGLRGYIFTVAMVVLLLVTVLKSPFNVFKPEIFPVEAANWLSNNPPKGKMFNYFTWGGYLLYRLWPEQQVFIDGQTDFYGETLSREYVQVESSTTRLGGYS
ncbi:MAG: hypothetical protein QM730_28835 [Anaerolineales bacterium]